MADKKEFVTSLVVEADDTQVAKLRDTLQQVSNLITGIQSRGAIGGGMGGGGAGGAGGGGGSGGGGGGGGGARGSDGGGGSGGGSGGGGGGGSGGTPPPAGPGGPKQIGTGLAQVVAQQDESMMASAAAALPSAIPILGAAAGIAVGGLVSAALARGRAAIEFDRQRAVTAGLLGKAPGIGSGAGLGFTPGETQTMAQTLARSGLSADDLFDRATTPGIFGVASIKRAPSSLFQAGLLAERAGIGAGSVADFLSMFRAGGGGAMSFGVRPDGTPIQGITDPMRMEHTLNLAIGGALRAGLQNADIPKYLSRIQGAVTAMADKGVQVDPRNLIVAAEQRAQMAGRTQAGTAGRTQAGTVDIAQTAHLLSLGQQVAQGGGSPLVQFLMRGAAGFGSGRDLLDTNMALEEEQYDTNNLYRFLRGVAGGSEAGRRAVTTFFAPQLGLGHRDLYNMLGNAEPEGVVRSLIDMAREGGEGLLRLGGRGVTKLMQQDAATQAADIDAGMSMAPVNLALRSAIHSMTNAATKKLGAGVQKLMTLVSGNPQQSAAAAADLLEAGADMFGVPADSRLGGMIKNTIRTYRGSIPQAPGIPGHPATQLPQPPNPKKGGAYIEIRPAPGMERWFMFSPMQDMSASEMPT